MTTYEMWVVLKDTAVRNGYQMKRNAPVLMRGDMVLMDTAVPTLFDPHFTYALFGETTRKTPYYTGNLEPLFLPAWLYHLHGATEVQAQMALGDTDSDMNVITYYYQELTTKR